MYFRERHFRTSWTHGTLVGWDSDCLYSGTALRGSGFCFSSVVHMCLNASQFLSVSMGFPCLKPTHLLTFHILGHGSLSSSQRLAQQLLLDVWQQGHPASGVGIWVCDLLLQGIDMGKGVLQSRLTCKAWRQRPASQLFLSHHVCYAKIAWSFGAGLLVFFSFSCACLEGPLWNMVLA